MQLDTLLSRLENELILAEEERDTGASDLSLQSVMELLQRAGASADAGRPGTGTGLLLEAAHQVADSWSFTSDLGVEVLHFVQASTRKSS